MRTIGRLGASILALAALAGGCDLSARHASGVELQPGFTVFSEDVAQQQLARWAVARFERAGLDRPMVEIARALLHSPQLLLLDEPTIGLDDPTRRAIVRHVHELARADNIGVLWATHLFDEVEPNDDLLVINRGKIVARGKAKDVVAETGAKDLGGAFRLLIGGDTEEDVAA